MSGFTAANLRRAGLMFLDRNKDGKVTRQEASTITPQRNKFGISPSMVVSNRLSLFNKLDLNRDGVVSLNKLA